MWGDYEQLQIAFNLAFCWKGKDEVELSSFTITVTQTYTKINKKWLHQKKNNVLQWLSQNPDLNLIEYLWGVIK